MGDAVISFVAMVVALTEMAADRFARFGERCLNNDFVYVFGLVGLGLVFGLLLGTQLGR